MRHSRESGNAARMRDFHKTKGVEMEVQNLGELEREREKNNGSRIFYNCDIDIHGMELDKGDIHLDIPEGDVIRFVLVVNSIKGVPAEFCGDTPRPPSAPMEEQCEMERADFSVVAEHVWGGWPFHVCAQESGEGVWRALSFCRAFERHNL